MTLTIAQSAHRADRRQWRWAVWLDGGPEELDEVAEVTYTLHPSFPEPVHVISDRASEFRLEAYGWGEFQLQVRIRHKDGRELELRHWLELAQDTDCTEPRRAAVPKRIFLSYTVTNAPLADAIARALVQRRVRVIRPDDFVGGVAWRAAIGQADRRSDALILMFTNRLSPSMEQELAHFRDAGKTMLAVVVFDSSPPRVIPPPLRNVKRLLVKWDAWEANRDALAGDVARRIIEKLSVDDRSHADDQ